jgi:CheY-like chemotaxis protein
VHILHLEYSAFFRKIVKEMIIDSGHSPIDSKYGADVFKILAQTDVSLIIMGFELADMTGEELIMTMKNSRYAHIPIVVITSLEEDEVKDRLKGIKVDEIIFKSELTADRFNNCIDRILES